MKLKYSGYTVKIVFFAILFGKSICCFSQDDIRTFISRKSDKINSIDPNDTIYTDLLPIMKAIGNSRIVMLGEQDHGDGSTFLAKTRLIKFLHERMGFNILAFESDFFNLTNGGDNIKTEAEVKNLISRNVYPVWVFCKQASELLLNYLPSTYNTKVPLKVAGIDNQMYNSNVFEALDSTINAMDLPIVHNSVFRNEIFPVIRNWSKNSSDSVLLNKANDYLYLIKSQMVASGKASELYLKLIDNLISQNNEFKYLKLNYWKGANIRDSQMAQNLKWLFKSKYPSDKILVWAANAHIAKYSGNYPDKIINPGISMGTVFTSDKNMEESTFIIGFTSFRGEAGRITSKKYTIHSPKKASFENWIDPSYAYSFTNFKALNDNGSSMVEFNLSGGIMTTRLHDNGMAFWNKVFDGVFFIRDMEACIINK